MNWDRAEVCRYIKQKTKPDNYFFVLRFTLIKNQIYFFIFITMKNRIINLLSEWIEEKILNLEHDKAIYHYNYRYWSYKSVSEEAVMRANRWIRILEKDLKLLYKIKERLEG